ncbi:hypothetical protein [Petrotoga sp. 9PWA.NaAc.5.4]|uniref:hypothetical protein n=1 Tax=Petrotoga sp. 9PWA.NaAc.5.4 TaxID=1434328 RepID=UPI000CBDEDB7|nr:hypothetical protein [Petrotoga sp. 9PWA.NaAc.5.4]PNR96846.1 hypothetical protein X924_02275 [Petrotoga sp. 9PWA.NaAc.5.4]
MEVIIIEYIKINFIIKIIFIIFLSFYYFPPSSIFSKNLSFEDIDIELSIESYHFHYKEFDEEGKLFMQEYGLITSISYSYVYNVNDFLFNYLGRISCGKVNYNGRTMNGRPLYLENIFNCAWETKATLGKKFLLNSKIGFTPSVGIGYRYLNDDLGKVYYGGYERESRYWYIPLNFETNINFSSSKTYGFNLEFDYFLKGLQKSHLSDFNPYYNDVVNVQNSGFGIKSRVFIEKELDKYEFLGALFSNFWYIKKSEISFLKYGDEIVAEVWEPENITLEIGLIMGLIF